MVSDVPKMSEPGRDLARAQHRAPMRWLGSARQLAGALPCLCCLAACSPTEPPSTQVIVRIDGDESVRTLSELRVELYPFDATSEEQAVERRPFRLTQGVPGPGQVRLPFSFVIAPGGADRFLLVLTGFRSGSSAAQIEQKAIASFRAEQTELLQLYLSDACFSQVCTGLRHTCHAETHGELASTSCMPVRTLETTPIMPGAELDLPPPLAPPVGESRDASVGDVGVAVPATDAPDAAVSAAPEAGAPVIPPLGRDASASGGPDAAVPAAGNTLDCAATPTLRDCAARCASRNECGSPDYPCVEVEPAGYTCQGQLADWPMPDSSPGAKHPGSYDASAVAGVVIDNVTKLQWQRTPAESLSGCRSDRVQNASPRAPSYACTWPEAVQYCAQLELGGASDWRLPSVIEALSLADDTRQGPAIDPIFYRTDAEKESAWHMVWTASSVVDRPDSAWVVDFSYGPASHASRLRSDALRVRCVRSGASLAGAVTYTPALRYRVEKAAGRVLDTRTGLTWEDPISGSPYDKDGAAAHCTALGADYRVPTRKELLTLVDFTRQLPAVVAPFTSTPSAPALGDRAADWFWTTTPWYLDRETPDSQCSASTCVQTVEFASGQTGLASPTMVDRHASRGYVRCVK